MEPSETFLQVFVRSLLPHHSLRARGEDTEELNQHLWWCFYQPGNSTATDNKEPAANLVFGGGLNRISRYSPPTTRESRDTESWTCCPLAPSHCTGVAFILSEKKKDHSVSCFIILYKNQKQSVQEHNPHTHTHTRDSSTFPLSELTDTVVADTAVRGARRAEHFAGVAVLEFHHILVYDHFHGAGRWAVGRGTHAVCKGKEGQSNWCRRNPNPRITLSCFLQGKGLAHALPVLIKS